MPAKDNEAQILSSILPNEPTVKLDLSLIPDLTASTQLRVGIQTLKAGLRLPVLSQERAATFVAVTRPDDIEYYGAYARALQRRPELAERTVSPTFFGRLQITGARMSALDMGATQLGEKLLQCALDLGQSFTDRSRLLADLLARPEEEIITGGITVQNARLLFSEFIKVCEDQERKAETRKDKADRIKARTEDAAEEARQQLDEAQRAERLRKRIAEGKIPALPTTKKGQIKNRSKQP